jgi:hypothetical protein
MATTLTSFLATRDVRKHPGQHATHTLMSGGSFFLLPDDEEHLFQLMAKMNAPPALVECSRADFLAPLVFDLDFTLRKTPDDGGRAWDAEHLGDSWPVEWQNELVLAAARTYKRVLEDMPNRISFHVFARPEGYVNGKGLFKDGIHIHAPTIFCHLNIHARVRELVIDELKWDNLGTIWDKAMCHASFTGKLLMYGTTKPRAQHEPYGLLQDLLVFDLAGVGSVMEDRSVDIPFRRECEDFIKLCSVRLERPVLSLREGVEIALEESIDGKDVVVVPQVAAVSDEQWLDVCDLVALLSKERAERSGLAHDDIKRGIGGCAQVINAIYATSGGDSGKGFELVCDFANTSDKHRNTPTQMPWLKDMWSKSSKHAKSIGALFNWAKEDSPELFKLFKPRVPLPSKPFTFQPPTEEETVALVKEVVPDLLEVVPEPWVLLGDRNGILPFQSRYLFGSNDLAGISDLTVFATPPPRDLSGDDPVRRSTVAISSHLGTGKTTLFVELAKARWPADGSVVVKKRRYRLPNGALGPMVKVEVP